MLSRRGRYLPGWAINTAVCTGTVVTAFGAEVEEMCAWHGALEELAGFCPLITQ